jgi:hypothetical protein
MAKITTTCYKGYNMHKGNFGVLVNRCRETALCFICNTLAEAKLWIDNNGI